MRPNALRLRLAAVGFGAIAAGMILGAAPARATPLSFVQSLNDAGISVYDATTALASGYRICGMLNTANGEVVSRYVFENSTWSDVPNMNTARTWVVVSVQELCAWHDHSGVAA